MKASKLSAETRFWSKVEKSEHGCWAWRGTKSKSGYGVFSSVDHRWIGAHRQAWIYCSGDIPAGIFVCHHCDNPECVRPDHLFLGSAAENMYDRYRKGRYATGAESWSANNLDRVARGDRSGLRLHPESILRGEKNPSAVLKQSDVEDIRKMLTLGLRHKFIAEKFGVDRTTITAINLGKNWKVA